MNIILSAINTKHTHSALALACLKSYWDLTNSQIPLTIKEFDLNMLNETIINELILMEPSILAFSTYIWSIERIVAVAGAIKAAFPQCIIILGGPEVSYNSENLLTKYWQVDYIIRGEGEITFKELLEALIAKRDTTHIRGITFRQDNKVVSNQNAAFIKNLDDLPSPFRTGNYKGTASFTYYEASRGCPSKCAYCLSSIQGNVRNFSMARIKEDLDWFFTSDFDQIRFADRTFNFDVKRAREILQYIKKNNVKRKNFHFEIQADFLSDEIIEELSEAPEGMFHLEIGIQSINPEALNRVHRSFNLDKLAENLKKLKNQTKCYMHLDVLGGLPYDTFRNFKETLDFVSSFSPEDIQISMVKVLHGTPYEHFARKYQIDYMSEPPYTVMKTKWLRAEEGVMISQISKLYEGIKNTGRFDLTLFYLADLMFEGSIANLFVDLTYCWRKNHFLFYNFSPENTVKRLKVYIQQYLTDEKEKEILNSKLEHELRLCLSTPNSDSWQGPDLPDQEKKFSYKLKSGYRAYWYKYNPTCNQREDIQANYPCIYDFPKPDEKGKLVNMVAENQIPKLFAMALIQRKVPVNCYEEIWNNLYPMNESPNFQEVIKDLLDKGDILYSSHCQPH